MLPDESHEIMRLVGAAGSVIEQMSIDEAYLDLSARCQDQDADASLRQALPIARELKRRIFAERQLTATIGIAANKLLAKIASDHRKPDGLTLIAEREKVPFLRPLPVRVLYGVGQVTEQILHQKDAASGVEVLVLNGPGGRADLAGAVEWLGRRRYLSLMIEAGSKLNWSALETGVVDRILFYYGPKILGGLEALPLAGGIGRRRRVDAIRVHNVTIHSIPPDEFAVEGYVHRDH